MTTTAKTINKIDAFSFMGLMASEGKIPGTQSGSANRHFYAAEAEEMTRQAVSDLTATGDFFSLMTEKGMMKPAPARKPIQIKITRPRALGGGFGGMNGGNFGGGAFAH